MNALSLLRELIRIPGAPGQEGEVRSFLASQVEQLGLAHSTDAKGNFFVGAMDANVVITAHMDEIAMIVTRVESDSLAVTSLGGLHPWKLGEGPVQILSDFGPVNGVLSFGSIHTANLQPSISWEAARVITGSDHKDIRPGMRVVIHPSRRELVPLGELVGGYFMDDRADLVSWLLALADLKEEALFIATVSEEVGGHGAAYALGGIRPEVCIALELGPNAKDAPVKLSKQPTVWVNDSYAQMSATDGQLVTKVGKQLGMELQFQALSRGGSDASCAASLGLCARPITLGIPMENSHGYEIIHPEAMSELARLTVALVREINTRG